MADLLALLPVIVTTAAAIGVMLVAGFSLFGREAMALLTTGLFMFCFFVQAATLVSMPFFPFQQSFGSMLAVSPFSGVAGLIILACGGFSALASQTYFSHNKGYVPEFYAMLLFAACGMLLLTMAAELITLFIALEIMSLAVYVLVGTDRERLLRAEAVLKYLMLGAFAGGFFVMGAMFVYGGLGTTSFAGISRVLAESGLFASPLATAGFLLILICFFFKIAVVPFHAWVVDVYDGAPLPVTGFMATAVKTAVFCALVNVLLTDGSLLSGWRDILWYLCVVTMFTGNLIALRQTNIKRMLAASGIVHSGYLLIAIVSADVTGVSRTVVGFYLAAYALANLGMFSALSTLSGSGEKRISFADFNGLAKVHPYSAAMITIFLLSMAGIPPTAGFMAKFYIITAAFSAGQLALGVLGLISTILSIYYYMRLVVAMYFAAPEDDFAVTGLALAPAGTAVLALAVFGFSLYPLGW